MIVDLELPAERDLPPGRAAATKARLRAEMRGPVRRPRARLALAGAVTAAVAAAAAVPLLLPEESPTTIAMGPGELSPSLSAAVDDCRYQCYADPDGKVVYPGLDRKINGKSGITQPAGRCLPAESWQR